MKKTKVKGIIGQLSYGGTLTDVFIDSYSHNSSNYNLLPLSISMKIEENPSSRFFGKLCCVRDFSELYISEGAWMHR